MVARPYSCYCRVRLLTLARETSHMELHTDDGIFTFHGSGSKQAAAAGAKHGATAALQLRPFNSGKGGGFHEIWSSGAPEVAQAIAALKPLQGKAFEIGDSNKEKIPCCCCCPPGFTEESAKNTAAEMKSGGFLDEASAAIAASGLRPRIETVDIVSESISYNDHPGGEDQDIATSALEVIMFLIPGVANPVVAEGADMSR